MIDDVPMVVCEKKPILSEGFRNFMFLLCIFSCVAVTGMNSYVTRLDQKSVRTVFSDLRVQAAQAQQIMIAQEYAMQVGTIAEYQTVRSHELEQKGQQLVEQFVKLSREIENLRFTAEIEHVSITRASGRCRCE